MLEVIDCYSAGGDCVIVLEELTVIVLEVVDCVIVLEVVD